MIPLLGHPKPARWLVALAATMITGAALAQSSVTLYGRLDLSMARQADSNKGREMRNGSGSRFGIKGREDLGDGLYAIFQLEHRFNADDGSNSTSRHWEGKSIVGLEGRLGRLTLGREENPAYTFSQGVADPWGTDTVASNGTIVNGRIGSTRYSNSVNYRFAAGAWSFGVQSADRDDSAGNGPLNERRPYSIGVAYSAGALTIGLGHENPADRDDHWTSVNASYDFGVAKLGAFIGDGRNASAQGHRAWLVSAVVPVGPGQVRSSYGVLRNRMLAVNGTLDRQFAIGYWYPMSPRTALYANVVSERRDAMPSDRATTGWDFGVRHNF